MEMASDKSGISTLALPQEIDENPPFSVTVSSKSSSAYVPRVDTELENNADGKMKVSPPFVSISTRTSADVCIFPLHVLSCAMFLSPLFFSVTKRVMVSFSETEHFLTASFNAAFSIFNVLIITFFLPALR